MELYIVHKFKTFNAAEIDKILRTKQDLKIPHETLKEVQLCCYIFVYFKLMR